MPPIRFAWRRSGLRAKGERASVRPIATEAATVVKRWSRFDRHMRIPTEQVCDEYGCPPDVINDVGLKVCDDGSFDAVRFRNR